MSQLSECVASFLTRLAIIILHLSQPVIWHDEMCVCVCGIDFLVSPLWTMVPYAPPPYPSPRTPGERLNVLLLVPRSLCNAVPQPGGRLTLNPGTYTLHDHDGTLSPPPTHTHTHTHKWLCDGAGLIAFHGGFWLGLVCKSHNPLYTVLVLLQSASCISSCRNLI